MKDIWRAQQPIAATPNRENIRNDENKVVEISGGELLKIAGANSPNIPIVYLGHRQTFVLACGDKGRKTKGSIQLDEARMQPGGKVSCP
jgi:hypothetical protein